MAPIGRRALVAGAGALGAVVLAAAAFSAFVMVYFARTVVTPPRRREQDVRIIASSDHSVTLSNTPDTMTPGRYSLWFSRDSGHARIGDILSADRTSVTRELLGVDFGDLARARAGRLSGWFFLGPGELGLPWEDVEVETPLGSAPAWLVPADVDDGRWVIQVHGRAVTRREPLRAVPVFRAAGYTSLLISYRNDGEAPRSADHRYALGDTEWEDVEAAIRFALDRGARSILLMGWSMGGATVLQTITRSTLADRISGLVLESPVVDWVTALRYQAVINRIPPLLRGGILALLSRPEARLLTGQSAPIDLRRLDLVARSAELHAPTLLLHSADDGYVPITASDDLAHARPDIVTYERFTTARHTKLWNFDPDRWNGAIARWLNGLGQPSA